MRSWSVQRSVAHDQGAAKPRAKSVQHRFSRWGKAIAFRKSVDDGHRLTHHLWRDLGANTDLAHGPRIDDHHGSDIGWSLPGRVQDAAKNGGGNYDGN